MAVRVKRDNVTSIQNANRAVVCRDGKVARAATDDRAASDVVDEKVGRRLQFECSDVCNRRSVAIPVAIASETSLISKQRRWIHRSGIDRRAHSSQGDGLRRASVVGQPEQVWFNRVGEVSNLVTCHLSKVEVRIFSNEIEADGRNGASAADKAFRASPTAHVVANDRSVQCQRTVHPGSTAMIAGHVKRDRRCEDRRVNIGLNVKTTAVTLR